MQNQSKSCASCNTPHRWLRRLKQCPVERKGCGQWFCSKCMDFAVVPEDEPIENPKITSVCKLCFKRLSNLDFNRSTTIIAAPDPTQSIIFVHGGGGCRLMFEPHAKQLVQRGPFKCILLDLPGHGSRMDEPLSLNTAIETILEVTREHGGLNPIYIGGSLGGYVGMELLGRYPTMFQGAVLMMCGQNTGIGAGLPARAGLWGFKTFLPMFSSATILGGLVSTAKSNRHLNVRMIYDGFLRTGAFFQQSFAQVKILEESDPNQSLPHFKGPVLFINGSRDHRDSENVWTSLCDGNLLVYDGGDHFFSHDNRFFNRLLDDLTRFICRFSS